MTPLSIGVFPNSSMNAAKSPGNLHPARWNSGQDDRTERRIALDDLVRDPAKRARNRFRVHDEDVGW